MTPAEALQEAARCGRFDQFDVSRHALERMMERNVTRYSVRLALQSATTATHEGGDKWRLDGGQDADGDRLGVVIVFTWQGLIVTVF